MFLFMRWAAVGAYELLVYLSAEVRVEIKRYKNIVAFRNAENEPIWGFHSFNMELAELSSQLWLALDSPEIDADLRTELDYWNIEQSADTKDAFDQNVVLKLSLNVVQICNLRCRYCAAGGDGSYGSAVKKLDLDLAYKQIAHFLQQYTAKNNDGVFHIQFLGGEPLLHPNIIEKLCQYAQLCVEGTNKKVVFSVTTNGTLINPKIAELLARYEFSVAISLDGDQNTNDKTRPTVSKNQSSTELTIRGLNHLLPVRQRLRALKINSVFGSHNLNIIESYRYLISLYPDWSEINLLYANNDDAENASTNSKMYIEQMRLVAAEAYKNRGLTGLAQIKQFQMVLSRVLAKTRIHSYCGAGKSLLQVDTTGQLFGCNWMMSDKNEKIGVGTVIDQNKKAALQPSLIELNNCQTCWSRHFCGGGCMYVHKSKTGNKHLKDPEFCDRTRSLGATALYFLAFNQSQNQEENSI